MQAVQANADAIREEVRRMVAEITEREEHEISDSAQFIDDLDVDSLMALEIMVALSKKYKIDIPEDEFTQLTNINETVESVMRRLPS